MENKKQGYKVRKYQGPVKRYCQMLKDKYGKQYPRRTELRNFDTIEAAKVRCV